MAIKFSETLNASLRMFEDYAGFPIELYQCVYADSQEIEFALTAQGYISRVSFADLPILGKTHETIREMNALLTRGVRQLQFQVHRYNDFQSAIALMAQESVN